MKVIMPERRKELKETWNVRRDEELKPVVIRIRCCLGCQENFESEGSHDRLCEECGRYGGMI